MSIALKIRLFVGAAIALFLVCAGAGYLGIERMATTLQFVSGPAWAAADGAMEGTIGIQQEMLGVNRVLAGSAQGRAMIEEGAATSAEAFGRMRSSGLIPAAELADLDGALKVYAAQRDAVLADPANVDAYRRAAADLLEVVGKIEASGDGQVENEVAAIGQLQRTAEVLLLAAVLTGIAAMVVAAFFGQRHISAPLGRLVSELNHLASDLGAGHGNLTVRFPDRGKDEIAALATSTNVLLSQFAELVNRVNQASGTLAGAAGSMSSIAEANNMGIQAQQGDLDQVATAMSEMTATAQEVANNAAHAAQASTEADKNTDEGRRVIEAALSGISVLASEVDRAAESIRLVESYSNNIGAILDVIRGIADQTNLLALNAAIEEARAGEQGRGFAVVADEVRTLAVRTQQSTQEIQNMIETLQKGTNDAVAVMESSHEHSVSTVEQATQAGETFSAIARSVTTISDLNAQIASAAEEQTAVSDDISQRLVSVRDVLNTSARGAHEVAGNSEQVASLAAELQSLTVGFRT